MAVAVGFPAATMAERTTKTGIAISSVDENYTAPANATPEEATKARLAAAMREGAKRQKVRSDAAIEGIKAAHVEEMNRVAARERAVGHHRAAWLYGIPALIVGAGISMFGMMAMQNYTAATLASNFREQAMTGAIIQANQTPQRCIPGETLEDGRICPQRQ